MNRAYRMKNGEWTVVGFDGLGLMRMTYDVLTHQQAVEEAKHLNRSQAADRALVASWDGIDRGE